MAIRKVGVVGAGLMGSGIAQTCAQSGYETIVREVNQEFLNKGVARIYSAWDMLASKGKLSQGQVDAGVDTGAAEVLPDLTPAADAAPAEASA